MGATQATRANQAGRRRRRRRQQQWQQQWQRQRQHHREGARGGAASEGGERGICRCRRRGISTSPVCLGFRTTSLQPTRPLFTLASLDSTPA